jgi:hypothetical protein
VQAELPLGLVEKLCGSHQTYYAMMRAEWVGRVGCGQIYRRTVELRDYSKYDRDTAY